MKDYVLSVSPNLWWVDLQKPFCLKSDLTCDSALQMHSALTATRWGKYYSHCTDKAEAELNNLLKVNTTGRSVISTQADWLWSYALSHCTILPFECLLISCYFLNSKENSIKLIVLLSQDSKSQTAEYAQSHIKSVEIQTQVFPLLKPILWTAKPPSHKPVVMTVYEFIHHNV